MRMTIDTNIFVYSIDERDPRRKEMACFIIDELVERDTPVALQVCGEFYAATTRRLGRSSWEAAQASRNLMAASATFAHSRQAMERAFAEAAAGRFSFWDAVLLASADEAGCRYIVSEDMSDGAKLGQVEVLHPFEGDNLNTRTREILGL